MNYHAHHHESAAASHPRASHHNIADTLLFHASYIIAIFLLLQLILWLLGIKPADRSNIEWWTALSTFTAHNGFFNTWTPYPPIFPAFHFLLLRLLVQDTSALYQYFFENNPTAAEPAAHAIQTMQWAWFAFNTLFLIAQAAIIYILAKKHHAREKAVLAPVAFIIFHLSWRSHMTLGPWSDQFDAIPGFFFLIALLLLLKGWDAGSAFAAALGIMTKVFPGLAIPLAWAHLKNFRRAFIYTAIVISICLLIAAPFLYVNAEYFITTYKWLGCRVGYESVWTYPRRPDPYMPVPKLFKGTFDLPFYDAILKTPAGNVPVRIIQENAPNMLIEFLDGERRQVPTALVARFQHIKPPSIKQRILQWTTIILLLLFTWRFRSALRTSDGLMRGALLFILVLLFFSMGVSHYYVLWFFPLLFIIYPPWLASTLVFIFLLVGNVEFIGATPELPGYWPSIFLRQALFLGLVIAQVRALIKT